MFYIYFAAARQSEPDTKYNFETPGIFNHRIVLQTAFCGYKNKKK